MTDYRNPASAQAYLATTQDIDLSPLHSGFLAHLPASPDPSPHLLDLGCGPGRDALAFRQAGYSVEALDPSPAMAALARAHAGVPVREFRAQDLEDTRAYDGIWACASLLHVPWDELPDVFGRLERALRPEGVLYASFKLGDGEWTADDGRCFTDMTEARLLDRVEAGSGLQVIEIRGSPDLRPGRAHERWLNALLRRTAP